MKFEITVDPNEETYINTRLAMITQKLGTALLLLLQDLHADDLRRTNFIGHGIDPVAMIESAARAERAAAEHATTFAQPADEIARKRQFDADLTAARRELRY